MKRFAFLAAFFLGVSPSFGQYALQFGAASAAEDGRIYIGEGRNLIQNGSLFVYESDSNGDWQMGKSIQASDSENAGNGFGRSISLAGNTLVVGAPLANAVYVFERSGNNEWIETAILKNGDEGLGTKLATDGNHILATAIEGRNGNPSVYTWKKTGNTWVAGAKLVTESGEGRTGWGNAISLSGGFAAVGSPFVNGNTGMVEVFKFANGLWNSQGALEYSAPQEGDAFGSSVLLAGEHMVVGMPGHDVRKGAATIYVRDAESEKYNYDLKIEPFDSKGNEQFGSSLALEGSTLWVSAPGYGNQNGAVYQYEVNPISMRMSSIKLLQPSNLQYRSGFGSSISVAGSTAIVGSQGHDNFEGAAFPFTMETSGWIAQNILYSDSGVFATVTGEQVTCDDLVAGDFPCEDVDMMSFLSRSDVGAKRGIQMNDVWGWTDPESEIEYAIIGRTDGTSFVSLADPSNPVFLGDLPYSASGHQSLHRDMKVYRNYAYIVADGAGAHHMQVFDLTQLRNVQGAPTVFKETGIYKGIYSSHNLIINEDSGFLYAVGSDSGGESCGGALHMIDLADPAVPVFAGCFNEPRTGRGGSGATHDAQCVNYHGPDPDYAGREICLSSNGTALSIADVTDKSNPVAVSIADYPSVAYAHQGWLTEDHRFFYLNDEGDEASDLVDATRTIIFDLTDLDEPELSGFYFADNSAIDHNLYVKGNLMYQTNYLAGLRILDISDPANPVEVASFDTVPYGPNDNSPVLGAWSNYPFFKSGVIVVSSGREGVFFLKKKVVDI